MNTQAFPRDFLQKFFPELTRANPTSVDSQTTEVVSTKANGVLLSATPRHINEPGIVEIILRVRVDSPHPGFAGGHRLELQQVETTTAAPSNRVVD
jgi:hypothetical protein